MRTGEILTIETDNCNPRQKHLTKGAWIETFPTTPKEIHDVAQHVADDDKAYYDGSSNQPEPDSLDHHPYVQRQQPVFVRLHVAKRMWGPLGGDAKRMAV